MRKVHPNYVPPSGPLDADVMVVGEAPGEQEVANGEPFVGEAGQLISRYFGRAKYPWEKVFKTNLCKYRPADNKFTNLIGTEELTKGLAELSEEIERVNPNVIVSCGAWPLYYLTSLKADRGKPGSGISSWRGSVVAGSMEHVPSAAGRKILITFHPAYIIRPSGFANHPVFYLDIKRVPLEAQSKSFNYPSYDALIDPPNARGIAADMMTSEWLTVDIETFGNTLACVGFADSRERGMCLTYENPEGWELSKILLASKVKKNFQFGVFDINYLWWHYGWETNNYAFDTYIAAANLMPEFRKRLEFLTSIYTPMPYYKTDRKKWKESGNQEILWQYNIKDCIAQHWIMEEQVQELEELYGS